MFHIIPADEAFSVNALREMEALAGPEYTMTGIVCTDCTRLGRQIFGQPRLQVRHATVKHVQYCCEVRDERAELDAEMEADYLAERRFERHLEDRGFDEARFQEDMEARMGIPM